MSDKICWRSLFEVLLYLFVGIGASLGITKGAGDLAVLGQVEGGDLLGLLDLLLVGLHLKFIDVEHQNKML